MIAREAAVLERLAESGISEQGLRLIKRKAREYDCQVREANYRAWIAQVEQTEELSLTDVKREIETLTIQPLFSVIMPVYNSNLTFLSRAIESVQAQSYPNWQLCIANDASSDKRIRLFLDNVASSERRISVVHRSVNGHIVAASNSAIEIARGNFLCFIDHDDEIPPNTLYWIAKEIEAHPDANLIYTDQDKIDIHGIRSDPYFKPRFDPDLLRSQNFVDHLATFRTEVVRQLGGLRAGFEGSQDYDLVLRVVDVSRPEQIKHVPKVLYHWRAIPGSIAYDANDKSYAPERSRAALRDHLKRNGIDAQALRAHPQFSLHRVKYALPAPTPLVSVIILTRYQTEMLRRCIDSVLFGTDYPSIELIIVDNRRHELATKAYLRSLKSDPRVKIINYDHEFNYSAINNFAAHESSGQFLCFLNDDVYCLQADWLDEMVRHASRPDIGAVGARLLYPSGHVQHAGVIGGYRGLAGHAFRYMPKEALGPWARGALIQNFLAVTAACMVIRRSVFNEVSGFNEADLAVLFNDVDLCLRVREAGYRNLYTPYAELVHLESVTRKDLTFESEYEFMRRRWGHILRSDPHLNPNLSREYESFLLPTKRAGR